MSHNHNHNHSSGEHHHHHVPELHSLSTVFIVSIVLNLLFVCVEAGVGLWEGSLGLLSDAGHNLSDVFSLLLALVAFQLAKVHANKRYTYGYKKSTILISLLNAVILLVAVGAIVAESIHKFSHPTAVDGAAISWTAGVGILVNGLTAWLLLKSGGEDLNVRGAFLHMAADTLVSVGVVVSGVVILLTGWVLIDPIVSLLIAVIILVSTWKLLVQSVRLSMDGVPGGVDYEAVVDMLRHEEHVTDVHHVHIWAISTTENALTAHVRLDEIDRMESVKEHLKHELHHHGIHHATLEFETDSCHCDEQECNCSNVDIPHHEHHHH
ncbi:MAG: cation transporter [Paludibacteraceae bacterium]|nr:cation transporter [Paludibacteraceae bacterium]